MSIPGKQEPLVNAFETDDAVMVLAPMPGVEPEDIVVRLEGDSLTLEAEMRDSGADRRYLHHEWSYGPYRRTIQLSTPVDGRAAHVTFGNGTLTVNLPKAPDFVPATLTVPKTGAARGKRKGRAR